MSKFSPTAGYINRSPGGTENRGGIKQGAGIVSFFP
jgi:hypothetical protein